MEFPNTMGISAEYQWQEVAVNPVEKNVTRRQQMSKHDFDLDEYVAPLIDGALPEANQGIYTNICDSNCGPAPQPQSPVPILTA